MHYTRNHQGPKIKFAGALKIFKLALINLISQSIRIVIHDAIDRKFL